MSTLSKSCDVIVGSSPDSVDETVAGRMTHAFLRTSQKTEELEHGGSAITPPRVGLVKFLSMFAIALACVVLVNWETTTSLSEQNPNDNDRVRLDCSEPENPYYEGSGEHDGFEWAERTHATSCVSDGSFRAGCEEYRKQTAKLFQCEKGK
jgi:hypothetical protein